MDLVKALRLDFDDRSPHVLSLTGGGGKTSTMRRLAAELTARSVRVVTTSTTRLAAHEVETTPGVVLVSEARVPYSAVERALDAYGQCLMVTPEIVEGGVQKYPGVSAELVDAVAGRAGSLGIGAIVVEADGAKMLPLKAPAEHEPNLPASTTLLCPVVGMDALGRRITPGSVHRPERVRNLLGLEAHEDVRIGPAAIARLLLHPDGGRKGVSPSLRFLPILNKADSAPTRAGARIAAERMARERVCTLIASTGAAGAGAVHERWGPVAAIVLAAGEGSRFGGPKQLAAVDGEPMLARAVRTALDADVTAVVVVTGAYQRAVTDDLRERFGKQVNLDIVHNPAWRSGQASSLRAGLFALPESTQAALILPADQPSMDASLLRRLVRGWRGGHDIVAPMVDGDVRGAPALFDRNYWPALLAVHGDVGGRNLLRRHAGQVFGVPTEAKLLVDIDSVSDLEVGA